MKRQSATRALLFSAGCEHAAEATQKSSRSRRFPSVPLLLAGLLANGKKGLGSAGQGGQARGSQGVVVDAGRAEWQRHARPNGPHGLQQAPVGESENGRAAGKRRRQRMKRGQALSKSRFCQIEATPGQGLFILCGLCGTRVSTLAHFSAIAAKPAWNQQELAVSVSTPGRAPSIEELEVRPRGSASRQRKNPSS